MTFTTTKSLDCSIQRFREEFFSPEFTKLCYETLPTRQSSSVSLWVLDPKSSNQVDGARYSRTLSYLQSVPAVQADPSDLSQSHTSAQWASVTEAQHLRVAPEGTLHLASTASLTLAAAPEGPHLSPAGGAPLFGQVTAQWLVSPRLDVPAAEEAVFLQYQLLQAAYRGRIRYLQPLIERALRDEAVALLEHFVARASERLHPDSLRHPAASPAADASDSSAGESSADERFYEMDAAGPAEDAPSLQLSLENLRHLAAASQARLRSLDNRIGALERRQQAAQRSPAQPSAPAHGPGDFEGLASALVASSSAGGHGALEPLVVERLEQFSKHVDVIQEQYRRRQAQESGATAELVARLEALETFRSFAIVVGGVALVSSLFYFSRNLRHIFLRPLKSITENDYPDPSLL